MEHGTFPASICLLRFSWIPLVTSYETPKNAKKPRANQIEEGGGEGSQWKWRGVEKGGEKAGLF
jgi:hypothetical protein